MQPLFTILVGEYLVGSHIEQNLSCPEGKTVNVWVPSKDICIDVLPRCLIRPTDSGKMHENPRHDAAFSVLRGQSDMVI